MFKKIITSRKGRKCQHPKCKHILSIYNHETYCHVHSQQRQRAPVSSQSVKT